MRDLIKNIATSLPFLLSAVFPLLALFGFFDRRINGNSQFRTRRFIVTITFIGLINTALFFVFFYNLKYLDAKSEKAAETSVLKSMAAEEYSLNNISTMFPADFNNQKKSCFQAALSNYVQDQWDKASQAQLKNTLEEPHRSIFFQIQAMEYKVNSIWPIAAVNIKKESQIFAQPDLNGRIPEPPDDRMLAEYHQYLNNCTSYQVLPWAKSDTTLIQTHRNICLGICS